MYDLMNSKCFVTLSSPNTRVYKSVVHEPHASELLGLFVKRTHPSSIPNLSNQNILGGVLANYQQIISKHRGLNAQTLINQCY